MSIDTDGFAPRRHRERMVDLVHRLRRIASMAGSARLQSLEDALRADGRGGRALLEQTDPRDIAQALMRLADALGFECLAHAQRLIAWCQMLGDAARLSAREQGDLVLGCMVHDIGKLGIAADVLGDDDALTATELDWIRMHSSLGHALLANVAGLSGARDLVLSHHEYWNGSGYPEARRGADIPRLARVFGLVDSYEAIVRDDVGYRARRDHDAARAELIELAGIRYDAELVELFARLDPARWVAVFDAPVKLAA